MSATEDGGPSTTAPHRPSIGSAAVWTTSSVILIATASAVLTYVWATHNPSPVALGPRYGTKAEMTKVRPSWCLTRHPAPI